MKTAWYFSLAVLVNISFFVGFVKAQSDYATCGTKTRVHAVISINQAIFPGTNAIVCERQYQKQYDSDCVPGTD